MTTSPPPPSSSGKKPPFKKKGFASKRGSDSKPSSFKKSYSGGKKSFSGEKKSYGGDRDKRDRGEGDSTSKSRPFKKSYSGDKKSFSGEKKSYGGDRDKRDRKEGDSASSSRPFKKSYGGDKKSFSGEKRSFGGDRDRRDRGDRGGRGDRGDRRERQGAVSDSRAEMAKKMNRAWETPKEDTRFVAVSVLRRIYSQQASPQSLLETQIKFLDKPDQRLVHHLVMVALRYRLFLDAQIQTVAERAIEDMDPELRSLLHIGLVQILFTRIPAYAAVNSVVRVVKPSKRGFINALLRRLEERSGDILESLNKEDGLDTVIPKVFFDKWTKVYGLSDTRKMIAQILEPPCLDICFKTEEDKEIFIQRAQKKKDAPAETLVEKSDETSTEASSETSDEASDETSDETTTEVSSEVPVETATQSEDPPVSATQKDLEASFHRLPQEVIDFPFIRGVRVKNMSSTVPRLPLYKEGAWWVADVSSAFVVEALDRLLKEQDADGSRDKDKTSDKDGLSGKHVFDMCAAPGGKTMGLLRRGAHVFAVDRSETRMQTLHRNIQRVGMGENLETMLGDSSEIFRSSFDAVLLDSPCSSTGTLRRHPEGFFEKDPYDLKGFSKVQERLINHGLSCLKPKGILIYSVCSLEPEEGEVLIRRVLNKNQNIRRVAFRRRHIQPFSSGLTADGDLRILPHHLAPQGGNDGFFMCALQMKESF